MLGKPGSPEAQMIPAAVAHQPLSTATDRSRRSPGFSQLLRKGTGRSQGRVLCEDPSDAVGTHPLSLPALPSNASGSRERGSATSGRSAQVGGAAPAPCQRPWLQTPAGEWCLGPVSVEGAVFALSLLWGLVSHRVRKHDVHICVFLTRLPSPFPLQHSLRSMSHLCFLQLRTGWDAGEK